MLRSSHISPRIRRSFLLALVGGSAMWGCFIETPPPPASRFVCEGSADCDVAEGEICASGLCQVPCTLASFSTDCDPSLGYAACFNGFCAHLCEVEDSQCTSPQQCLSLGISLNDTGATSGVCGIECTSAGCPEGETCVAGGVCLTSCDEANPTTCGADELCSGGVCLPAASTP